MGEGGSPFSFCHAPARGVWRSAEAPMLRVSPYTGTQATCYRLCVGSGQQHGPGKCMREGPSPFAVEMSETDGIRTLVAMLAVADPLPFPPSSFPVAFVVFVVSRIFGNNGGDHITIHATTLPTSTSTLMSTFTATSTTPVSDDRAQRCRDGGAV